MIILPQTALRLRGNDTRTGQDKYVDGTESRNITGE